MENLGATRMQIGATDGIFFVRALSGVESEEKYLGGIWLVGAMEQIFFMRNWKNTRSQKIGSEALYGAVGKKLDLDSCTIRGGRKKNHAYYGDDVRNSFFGKNMLNFYNR